MNHEHKMGRWLHGLVTILPGTQRSRADGLSISDIVIVPLGCLRVILEWIRPGSSRNLALDTPLRCGP